MRLKVLFVSILAMMMVVACDSKQRVKAPEAEQSMAAPQLSSANNHTVKVEEVIQAKSYTYLRVTEGNQEYWIATAKQPIEAGITLTYEQGIEMRDFASKELDKTFESIWFVGLMSTPNASPKKADAVSPYGKEKVAPAKDISIAKVAGGLSIEELYAGMAKYDGKVVTVSGEVTKFNAGIMGRNWVHIQDGTADGDNFDLTLTTQTVVKMGDTVVFSGKVALNKDFGAGYKYILILEEAELSAES